MVCEVKDTSKEPARLFYKGPPGVSYMQIGLFMVKRLNVNLKFKKL